MWILLLMACSGDDGTDDKQVTDDPPTDDTEVPTGDTFIVGPTGDTGEPPPPDPPELTGVTATLHPDIGSIVVVTWEQDSTADVHAEWSFDAGEWWVSPVRSLDAGPHEEWLLGVPYGIEVTFELVAEGPGGLTHSTPTAITTDDVPETMPLPTVRVDDVANQNPSTPYVFTSMNEDAPGFTDLAWAFIVDRRGRAVWGKLSPQQRTTFHARPSYDGQSLLIEHNSFWAVFDLGAASTVERTLIDGSVVETFDTPGLHHPFVELPSGSIAYGAATSWSTETVQVAHPDGTQDLLFDCDAWANANNVWDGCASNTLNYDDATDTLLFSLYSAETIIEIDATTGAALRWFGHADGSYAFSPPTSAFFWQHGGHWTAAGTLMTSTHDALANEILVREYTVDAKTQTLTEIWNFGIGDGVFGGQMGEAHRLDNGNTLHNTGSLPRLREAMPDGTVVWDLEWGPGHDIGRSTMLGDLYALAPDRL